MTTTASNATADREMAIVALYALAAVETDAGGAGYSEGMAQRLRERDEDVSEDYVERILAAVDAARPEVEAVSVSSKSLRVMRDGRWLCTIRTHDEAVAARVAALVAGASQS